MAKFITHCFSEALRLLFSVYILTPFLFIFLLFIGVV